MTTRTCENDDTTLFFMIRTVREHSPDAWGGRKAEGGFDSRPPRKRARTAFGP